LDKDGGETQMRNCFMLVGYYYMRTLNVALLLFQIQVITEAHIEIWG
jgi:hypothetical protein